VYFSDAGVKITIAFIKIFKSYKFNLVSEFMYVRRMVFRYLFFNEASLYMLPCCRQLVKPGDDDGPAFVA
jgi:hypothetical protein